MFIPSQAKSKPIQTIGQRVYVVSLAPHRKAVKLINITLKSKRKINI